MSICLRSVKIIRAFQCWQTGADVLFWINKFKMEIVVECILLALHKYVLNTVSWQGDT